MIEVDFELKSKLRTRLQFPKSIRGSVQSSHDLLDFGFIFKWKKGAGGPCPWAVDRARMAGPTDHRGLTVAGWRWKTARVGRSWATKARRLGRTGPRPARVWARWVGRRGIEKKKGKAMTDRAEMVSQAENKEEKNWAEKINF
jgi:hypothetical protein